MLIGLRPESTVMMINIITDICTISHFLGRFSRFIVQYLLFDVNVLQTVRVQSAEHGTKRIETKGSESVANFFKKVRS